jgi:hypothetical protein
MMEFVFAGIVAFKTVVQANGIVMLTNVFVFVYIVWKFIGFKPVIVRTFTFVKYLGRKGLLFPQLLALA